MLLCLYFYCLYSRCLKRKLSLLYHTDTSRHQLVSNKHKKDKKKIIFTLQIALYENKMEENDLKNLSSPEIDAVSDLEKNSISIQAGDPSIKMVRFSVERESEGSRWKENVRYRKKMFLVDETDRFYNVKLLLSNNLLSLVGLI